VNLGGERRKDAAQELATLRHSTVFIGERHLNSRQLMSHYDDRLNPPAGFFWILCRPKETVQPTTAGNQIVGLIAKEFLGIRQARP